MPFLSILIWLFVLSFAGMVSLLGFKIYFAKNLSRDELCGDIISGKPFLHGSGLCHAKTVAGYAKCFLLKLISVIFGKQAGWFKKHFCRFSDYANGKHRVESKEPKGYWKKVGTDKEKKG